MDGDRDGKQGVQVVEEVGGQNERNIGESRQRLRGRSGVRNRGVEGHFWNNFGGGD